MREVYKQVSKELDIPKDKVEEIWQSQFKFVLSNMKENYMNTKAPSIKLTGFGTFQPNVKQIEKVKEKHGNKHKSKGQVAGITED